ncbi:expressed unknown protein [Seminavis robusta]|uniref:Uncharacterized protein n=1 Tax=Seminavis robusta TaxID=568900 RepID=A0A9N8DHZ1_9STRA|nr:expressed unknown protein [Seminavis robusta]|eukprot:Sro94_g048970.1 n/a (467) ;mRNA; r:51204-52604
MASTQGTTIGTNADTTLEEGSSVKMMMTTTERTNSSSLTNNNTSSQQQQHPSFIDYTPPPEVKILPPAKYKLWLLVFVLVYFASWVASAADLTGFLRFQGWLAPEASLFLTLAIIVFVLVYGTMDLVITGLTVTTHAGKTYGVGAWLKQPRAQWMYTHENILFEVLARVIHILEEGFSMFDAPPSPLIKLQQQQQQSVLPTRQFDCPDGTCEQVLKIEHRIRPDKLDDYQKWVVRIRGAVEHANGLVSIEKTEITRTVWDDQEDDEEQQQQADNKIAGEQLYQVVYLKFTNLDYLNDWMLSPRRKALMRALEPMLIVPDIVQIQSQRELPDAFTDLLTRQGHAVAKSPPKKWKVWWLTLLALFITIRWSGSFLPYYYDKWGLTQADERLERIVTSFVATFLNSYVMAPLFLFLFDHWLQHSDVKSKNIRQPWKTLDEGFQSIWPKVFLTVAFYGGCAIAAVVKQHG